MKTQVSERTKSISIIFSVLALAAVGAIAPHAFAQVSYTASDDPHGALQPIGWMAGMAVAGIMAGIGVFTAIRRGRLH